ncbi:MAG: gliding motility-associated C-terminal domain-containing protein [Elusimicrobia bacterium]|nr:gliding motility-associated C-terminal domain-containing protein [Candidatus Liberimonas magnetica]
MVKKFVCFLMILFLSTSAAVGKTIFSPNKDGIKDTAVFKLAVTTPKEDISRWAFEIRNTNKQLIKIFKGDGPPPERLEWDGRDENQILVADGIYSYDFNVITKAGNKEAIAPQDIIIDRTIPNASLSVNLIEFSPNGDGIKDEVTFSLAAGDDNGINSWLLSIEEKDNMAVRSFSGVGDVKPASVWDGKGNFNEDVIDGIYNFYLLVQDNAGNRFKTQPQTLKLTREAKVSLLKVYPQVFSPNDDGRKDILNIDVSIADVTSTGLWKLNILNSTGKIVKEISGKGAPPHRFYWDGKDDKKQAVNDGVYSLVLSETDNAGNTVSAAPVYADVDNTPPMLRVGLDNKIFSPNGDKKYEETTFSLNITDDHSVEWKLSILNDISKPVKTFSGMGNKQKEVFVWDGKDDNKKDLNDGIYTYYMEALDIADNETRIPKETVQIDRTPPVITAGVAPALFSPNNDGILDETTFTLNIRDASPLESWKLAIKNSSQKVVKVFKGLGSAVENIVWDGKSDDRGILPDGTYRWHVEASDVVGNSSVNEPQALVIGATKPNIGVVSDLDVFSPNADGFKDSVKFSITVSAFNKIKEWKLKILRGKTEVLRTFRGSGNPPQSISWLGENDDKKILPDGKYDYLLEVTDEAGNNVLSILKPIVIDTTSPVLKVSAAPVIFSPNGDGYKDEANFSLIYEDESPCEKYELVIEDNIEPCRSFSGTGAPPLNAVWEGKNKDKVVLKDGIYNYFFKAKDIVGNQTVTMKQTVKIDNTPPEVWLSADPTLFSPNNDGERDTTTFSIEYKDASDISEWALKAVYTDAALRVFKDRGRPSQNIIWKGDNDRGNPLPDGEYNAQLLIKDEVGNEGKSSIVKVKLDTTKPIVSITPEEEPITLLAPAQYFVETKRGTVISLAAELLFDTGKADIKPLARETLLKAASLIKKSPDRQVSVEGHTDTVPIHNEEFQNNQVLSQKRAESVVNFFVSEAQIPRERFTMTGYGETKPIDSNSTEEGRRKNRRVEIIIQK